MFENILAFAPPIDPKIFTSDVLGRISVDVGRIVGTSLKFLPLVNYLSKRLGNKPKVDAEQDKADAKRVVTVKDACDVVRSILYDNAHIAIAAAEEANKAVEPLGGGEGEVGFNAMAEIICREIRLNALQQDNPRKTVEKTVFTRKF